MASPVFQVPTEGESQYETYRRMRQHGPIVPVEMHGSVPAWCVLSHELVKEVLRGDGKTFGKDPKHCPALRDGTIPEDWPWRMLAEADHMLNKDGEEHRIRRLSISRAFTPARVAALAPNVEKIVNETIDAFPGNEFDAVEYFTTPIPVRVICEMFGVAREDQPRIREWTSAIVSHTSTADQMIAAYGAMQGFLGDILDRKLKDPGDDLTSVLVQANLENEKLSKEDLVGILWLVILAGHETTVHLLGHAIIALCANRDQLALAIEEDRWADVVEETLRYRSSVVTAFVRYAIRDVTLGGVDIPAGAMILWYGGVGTDPDYHANADKFDIRRDQKEQLAFGHGPHFCIGTPLARLESRIALKTLFTRYPNLELGRPAEEIQYTPALSTVGPIDLPIRLEPAG